MRMTSGAGEREQQPRQQHSEHDGQRLGLRIATDPAHELHELMELNNRRPEVFPKMFIVFGDLSEVQASITNPSSTIVLVDDACRPNWVAPRSEVTRHGTMLRMFGDQGQVRLELEVRQGR